MLFQSINSCLYEFQNIIGIFHNSTSTNTILDQINGVHILTYFFKNHLIKFSLIKLLSYIDSLIMDLIIFQTCYCHRRRPPPPPHNHPIHYMTCRGYVYENYICWQKHLCSRLFASMHYNLYSLWLNLFPTVTMSHSCQSLTTLSTQIFGKQWLYTPTCISAVSLFWNYSVSSVPLRRFMPFS